MNKYLEKIAEMSSTDTNVLPLVTTGANALVGALSWPINRAVLESKIPKSKKENWVGLHHTGYNSLGAIVGAGLGGTLSHTLGSHPAVGATLGFLGGSYLGGRYHLKNSDDFKDE